MASIHELLERGLQRVAEALIFAADMSVQAEEIANVYAEVTGEDMPTEMQVREAVDRLNKIYEESDRTFRIETWAEGFRMATVASVAPFLKSYFNREQEQRLSRSLMETLSIVAYKQPVTKPEVDFVRGVDSGYAVNKLLEKGMIDVVGRSDSLGRPLLYGTTHFFLEQFGLKDVEELPDLREIEEILDDPAFNRERAQLLELEREEELTAGARTASGKSGEGDDAGSGEGASGKTPQGDHPASDGDGSAKSAEDVSNGAPDSETVRE